MFNRIIRLSLASLALSQLFLTAETTVWIQSASAQYGQQKVGTTTYDPRRTKEQDPEFKANQLDRPIALPGLPDFTGKQHFISGLVYPNAKQGPGYFLSFNTENTEQQVKDWWRAALQGGQWSLIFQDDRCVRGRLKDGSTCTVQVEAPLNSTKDKMKNCRSSYSIHYHQVK
ncbi:MAG: hypothetical protein IPM23_17960 [Candidatus Melainabacteria bacterium]|nr:hypothetical protein [Candidatus Melainabacteria bacterium]